MSAPPRRLRFAVASCQYPGGLLDRGTRFKSGPSRAHDVGPAYASLTPLARRLHDREVGLLLLCGDSIYADETAGLFDPATLDDSLSVAYGTLGTRIGELRLEQVPRAVMLDDHEIGNNWEPDRPGGPSDELLRQRREGAQAYIERWRRRGFGKIKGNYRDAARLWFHFEHGGLRFFIADTRTVREHRAVATLGTASILGKRQWRELERWLADAPRDRPSFVLSPSMVLPRRLAVRDDALAAIRSDAWDGYPWSLHTLLRRLISVGNDRIVLLSGDEHLSCVARIALGLASAPRRRVIVHSIQSSALYAPYPFANSIAEDLAGCERFPVTQVSDPEVCEVETWFPPPGDGFAVVTVERDSGGWSMHVSFDRAESSRGRRYRL